MIAASWPDFDDALIDPESAAEIDWAVRLIGEVRTVRAEMNVPPKTLVELLLKDADEGVMARRPHRTHACQTGGMQWKPALVATAGVQFLPGCRDEDRNLIGGGPKKAPGGQP